MAIRKAQAVETTDTGVAEELLNLSKKFEKWGNTPSIVEKGYCTTQMLDNKSLKSVIRAAVEKLQEVCGIEVGTPFIQACFKSSGAFSGLRRPSIAKIDGKASIVVDEKPYDVKAFHSKISFFQEFENDDNGKKSYQYVAVYHDSDVDGCEALPFPYYCNGSKLDVSKLKKNYDYFETNCAEYTFTLVSLEPGTYEIEKYWKIGRFFVASIKGNQYYIFENQATQLNERKLNNKSLGVVIQEPQKTPTGIKKRFYIEGYAPAMPIKYFVKDLGIEPSAEELVPGKLFTFENPVVLDVKDVTTATDRDGNSKNAIACLHNGTQVVLACNSKLNKAITNDVFTLDEGQTYDGYQIQITGVKLGGLGKEYMIKIEVPESPVSSDDAELFASMGKNLGFAVN